MTSDLDPIISLCETLFSPDTGWAEIHESGLSLLMVPEALDGFGGRAQALWAVAREAGFAGLRQPVCERALLPGFVLGAVADTGLLRDFLTGAVCVAVTDDPVRIAGAGVADAIFTVRDGRLRLARPAPGDLSPGAGIDGAPEQRIAAGVAAQEFGAPALAARAGRYLILARAAEIAGAADRAVALTASFLTERRQFGQPLSAFQALRHRLVDAMIAAQEVHALSLRLALELDLAPEGDHDAMLDAMRIKAAEAAERVATETVQLHGGVGTTEEYLISHLFRRLTRLSLELEPRAAMERLSHRPEALLEPA